MRTLLFLNPTFHPGDNYTVRLGKKWHDRVSVGEHVYLAETGAEELPLHEARISGKYLFKLDDLPQHVLDCEHNPRCRTRDGMKAGMREAYPDVVDWDEQEMTVLRFSLTPPSGESV